MTMMMQGIWGLIKVKLLVCLRFVMLQIQGTNSKMTLGLTRAWPMIGTLIGEHKHQQCYMLRRPAAHHGSAYGYPLDGSIPLWDYYSLAMFPNAAKYLTLYSGIQFWSSGFKCPPDVVGWVDCKTVSVHCFHWLLISTRIRILIGIKVSAHIQNIVLQQWTLSITV